MLIFAIIYTQSEMEAMRQQHEHDIEYKRKLNELEIERTQKLADIEVLRMHLCLLQYTLTSCSNFLNMPLLFTLREYARFCFFFTTALHVMQV